MKVHGGLNYFLFPEKTLFWYISNKLLGYCHGNVKGQPNAKTTIKIKQLLTK